ncbi:uncharacterized protein LOC130456438 [Monodelphis domestica]|uniref:uncharacterized protein LOC130456438 n=1 Tax=Monodelphis domestica TaxID=13616 RepID=UPI0024E1F75F|nr:uncharacterized protein LOC130456438 [Monodelphis domestica]
MQRCGCGCGEDSFARAWLLSGIACGTHLLWQWDAHYARLPPTALPREPQVHPYPQRTAAGDSSSSNSSSSSSSSSRRWRWRRRRWRLWQWSGRSWWGWWRQRLGWWRRQWRQRWRSWGLLVDARRRQLVIGVGRGRQGEEEERQRPEAKKEEARGGEVRSSWAALVGCAGRSYLPLYPGCPRPPPAGH